MGRGIRRWKENRGWRGGGEIEEGVFAITAFVAITYCTCYIGTYFVLTVTRMVVYVTDKVDDNKRHHSYQRHYHSYVIPTLMFTGNDIISLKDFLVSRE